MADSQPLDHVKSSVTVAPRSQIQQGDALCLSGVESTGQVVLYSPPLEGLDS